MKYSALIFIFLITLLSGCDLQQPIEVQKWDKVELTFEGPESAEDAEVNPFTDYRLNVTFSYGEKTYIVPGYFAADGDAGETSAVAGKTWKVVFRPDEIGEWTYTASFRMGENIAIDLNPDAGEAIAFDGSNGKINVKPDLASLPDLRAKGRLNYIGERYLQFQESGEYFLKGGADSPENLLGYVDFDGTYKGSSPEKRSGEA